MARLPRRYRSRQRIKTRLPNVAPFIDTIQGRAQFVCTEIEDSLGRWDDDYWTRDGYFVIHEGKRHHVYKVVKRDE